ncbi:MAG TPA: hypothetical protein PLQ47_03395, partial [Candidatus Marinimicrobia bacterium]|nr:hypothetical protein [Candidatus Neomarinimicrobiota bacterium]
SLFSAFLLSLIFLGLGRINRQIRQELPNEKNPKSQITNFKSQIPNSKSQIPNSKSQIVKPISAKMSPVSCLLSPFLNLSHNIFTNDQ